MSPGLNRLTPDRRKTPGHKPSPTLPMIPARAGRLRLAPATRFPPFAATGSWPTPSLTGRQPEAPGRLRRDALPLPYGMGSSRSITSASLKSSARSNCMNSTTSIRREPDSIFATYEGGRSSRLASSRTPTLAPCRSSTRSNRKRSYSAVLTDRAIANQGGQLVRCPIAAFLKREHRTALRSEA